MATLVQFSFATEGPFGQEMSRAYAGLADDIAQAPGLRWKIWTENAPAHQTGGIYLFDDTASAQAYTEMHTARLAGFGITDIQALIFDINEPLTATTRGPVSDH